jgi:formylglycine-generating enzyme required for sulfatase activity
LDKEGGIIFFDGLDEVGEAEEARKRTIILQAVKDFSNPLKKCRVMVTCREYAYQEKKSNAGIDWRLPQSDFPVTELDLFRDEQIQSFSRAWYRIMGSQKGWSREKCDAEADDFSKGVLSTPNLKSLGENPLLLTLMAQIHGRTGLPKDRADLYERVVKLLLAHWENRMVRDVDGTCRLEPWIVMKLGVPVDTLREPLEKVAFRAHEEQEKAVGDSLTCADIFREDLRRELAAKLNNDLNKAEKFINYIENRAGLLQAVDNRIFRFPHRTFQEYLTATGIMRTSDFEDVLAKRLRCAPSWWQEVFLLATGSTRNTPRNIYMLLDALLAEDPNPENLTPENVLMAQIAARAIYESNFMERVKEEIRSSSTGRYSKIHRRIQKWLLDAITADAILTPEQRVGAGNALNWVEDPRFNSEKWFLPDDENLGFVNIQAGPFKMGSDKTIDYDAREEEFPQHSVMLSAYFIGRYPVTVAQYREFATDIGCELDETWKKFNNYDNHPVVRVSWVDAVAYCEWLTGKLKADGIEGIITLPTEAQWEKAARGNDGRIYLWGDDEIDPNSANYGDTNIGMTSSVGCFPGGKSPYDILDMSGNVWEWCLDWYGDYPDHYVIDPKGPDDGARRVLRGGSWRLDAGLCRAACRLRDLPDFRFNLGGFRLVCLPGQPGEPSGSGKDAECGSD